jgi:hypothetical protein
MKHLDQGDMYLGSRDSSAANTLCYKETGAQALTAAQKAPHSYYRAREALRCTLCHVPSPAEGRLYSNVQQRR